MSILEFLSTFIGDNPVQDADPITDSQPDVTNETAQGEKDGDETRATQLNILKYKLQAACKLVGDSINGPVGSLCEILGRDHVNGDATRLRLRDLAGDPVSAASKGFVYAKTVGSFVELFFVDSSGAITQLTSGGALAINETGGPQILTVGAVIDGQLVARVGNNLVGQTKRNLTATVAPSATDDSDSDYSPGSLWVDVTNDKAYICVDDTAAAAVWLDVTSGGAASVPVQDDSVEVVAVPTAFNFTGAGVTVTDVGNVATIDVPGGSGIPATGVAVTLFADAPASTQTISSGTFADVPGSALPEDTFPITVGGTYDLQAILTSLSSVTTNQQSRADYQLIIDEGDFNGFTEQIIGARAETPTEWSVFTANGGTTAWEAITSFGSAVLGVGTHKAKIQAKNSLGNPRLSSDGFFRVKGVLRASAAIEAVTALSVVPTATRSTTSAAFVDVDAEVADSFTITSAGSKLITMQVNGFRVTGAVSIGRFQIDISGATTATVGVDDYSWGFTAKTDRASASFSAPVTLNAGVHNIKIQWKRTDGAGTLIADVGTGFTVTLVG